MEFAELIKIWGPLAIGWVVAGYLMKFILDRYAQDIDARVKLASALDNLAKAVSEHGEKQNA